MILAYGAGNKHATYIHYWLASFAHRENLVRAMLTGYKRKAEPHD